MSLKFQLQSGKKIEIDIAPLEVCLNLYRAIVNECKNAGLDITIADGDTLVTLLMKNKEALLNIISSETVMEAIKDCCPKVLYDKQRFSDALFEKTENRKDYFPTLAIVGIENIRPFFAEPHIILNALQSQFLM